MAIRRANLWTFNINDFFEAVQLIIYGDAVDFDKLKEGAQHMSATNRS
jgi:hypothetical protein